MEIATIFMVAGALVIGIVSLILVVWVLGLRRVVPPGEVHIVQSKASGRVTYGKLPEDADSSHDGKIQNTYYEWPVWLPHVGVQVSKMDLSVFDQKLEEYKAYDNKRAPFVVDVMAFYRIADPQLAADRIKDMDTLHNQLTSSLKSAIRKILAEHPIDEIMAGRSEFGQKFTQELDDDLKAWGVKTVKNVELMDIRDDDDEADGGGVIAAIQARHTSYIKRESRIEVAENTRAAQEAEIQAKQQVAIKDQDAKRQVGEREAETVKLVGIAKQRSEQEVAAAEQETVKARMEVAREEAERRAEIDRSTAKISAAKDKEVAEVQAEQEKNVALVAADRDKAVAERKAEAEKIVVVKKAEAEKDRLVQIADGTLIEATKKAEGVRVNGEAEAVAIRAKGVAEGDAAKAKAMAPVEAEIKLQEAIGTNAGYQDFVVRQRQVDATRDVGIKQAEAMGEALGKAKIKVLSSLGAGSASLGNQLGNLMEGFALTDMGRAIAGKIGIKPVGDDEHFEEVDSGGGTGERTTGVRRVKRNEGLNGSGNHTS